MSELEAGSELFVAVAYHRQEGEGALNDVVIGVFTSAHLYTIGVESYCDEFKPTDGGNGPIAHVKVFRSTLNQHGLGPAVDGFDGAIGWSKHWADLPLPEATSAKPATVATKTARILIELGVACEDEGEALRVVNKVLDAGDLQDAITLYDDEGETLKIQYVVAKYDDAPAAKDRSKSKRRR